MSGFSEVMHSVGIESSLTSADVAGFESYAVLNAPLSDAQAAYPMLIFSHGAGGELTMYTAQHEELASQGYVVVAINHAYGASATVLPDGRTVFPDLSLGLEGTAPFWSQDQIFAIDQLEQINVSDSEGVFTNHLDLERLGIFGQSPRGAATMTCFVDERCKAGASEDGPVYGDVIEQGLEQPFLYLYVNDSIFADSAFYDQSRGPLYEVALDGFGHLDFSDLPPVENVEPIRDAG
jgi:predicted dienelactone hydrolase